MQPLMAESAALLMDDALLREHMRQRVFSVPFPLRFIFASHPVMMGKVLDIVCRSLATHLNKKKPSTEHALLPEACAPPQASFFD